MASLEPQGLSSHQGVHRQTPDKSHQNPYVNSTWSTLKSSDYQGLSSWSTCPFPCSARNFAPPAGSGPEKFPGKFRKLQATDHVCPNFECSQHRTSDLLSSATFDQSQLSVSTPFRHSSFAKMDHINDFWGWRRCTDLNLNTQTFV